MDNHHTKGFNLVISISVLSQVGNGDLIQAMHFTITKGPVKLMKRLENSSFIFTVCVKHYHLKLAYVILQMAV